MKNSYNVIVFDLGNTIIRFDHTISANKIARRFNLDPKHIYDMFFDSPITHAFEKGDISPQEFYEKAMELLGVSMSYADFVPIWNDIFWKDEDMCDLAIKLKSRYKLFLLSNVNMLHFEHIRNKFDIIKIFDELILSYIVRAMKPDRLIYEDVVRRGGGDRKKLLYIDDRDDLVKEAGILGIDSIKFEGIEKLKVDMVAKGIIF